MLTGKFVVVLVLLLVCLRVLKAVMPGGRGPGLGRGARMVLHSEALGDKQRVCLLDLQTSIVVIGVSPSGLTPLSTITGAEEMEQLRKCYAAQTGAGERTAWQLKGRLIKESILAPTMSFGDPVLADARDAMRVLRQKITQL
jgi:flagellar biogenesis protein FliO